MSDLVPTVEELLLLVEVIEAGGFTAASAKTGIPKSRLSRRIMQLEERLSGCVIERNSRRFRVTELGWRLHEHGLLIRSETRAAMFSALERTSQPSGPLRIACPSVLAESLVTDIALEFALRYPRVRVELNTTYGFGKPMSAPNDLVIFPSLDTLPDSDMVAIKLADYPHLLVARSDCFAASDWPDTPLMLMDKAAIGWDGEKSSSTWLLMGPDNQSIDVRMSIRFCADNLLTLHRAVVAGLGVARLPAMLCNNQIEQGLLRVITPGWSPPPVSMYAQYSSRRSLSMAGRAFLEMVTTALQREVERY